MFASLGLSLQLLGMVLGRNWFSGGLVHLGLGSPSRVTSWSHPFVFSTGPWAQEWEDENVNIWYGFGHKMVLGRACAVRARQSLTSDFGVKSIVVFFSTGPWAQEWEDQNAFFPFHDQKST